ncbi:MAG: hypothetical protein ACTSUE_25110 [Promethearchaeota archaeon]
MIGKHNKANFWNLTDLRVKPRKFRYLHGIEMEYFLLDEKFDPENDNSIYKVMIQNIFEILLDLIQDKPEYEEKITVMAIADEGRLKNREHGKRDIKKTKTIYLKYKQEQFSKEFGPIDVVGKDTNIGSGAYITLELVTPPCESVEELTWWLSTIQKATILGTRATNLNVVPIASHPNLETNAFCGEHHHVGIENHEERFKVYNLLRLFLPLMSVLSFTSFMPSSLPIEIQNDIFKTRVNNQFIRCNRLKETNQMGSVCPVHEDSKELFAREHRKGLESCRMVDMYPFTVYETLEVRVFDTQISIARSILVAILIQAVAMTASMIDDHLITQLNEIFPQEIYDLIKGRIITNGLSDGPFLKQRLTQSRPLMEKLRIICTACTSETSCDAKLFDKKCNFNGKTMFAHNLIAFLYFPKKFKMDGKEYEQINPKIKQKDKIVQMVHLLKDALRELNLNQFIPLFVLQKIIETGMEASIYLLLEYKKSGGDQEQFFTKLVNIQDKILNQSTKWGVYFDPFLEA